MYLSYSFLCAFVCQSQIFSTRNCSRQGSLDDCQKTGQQIRLTEKVQMCKMHPRHFKQELLCLCSIYLYDKSSHFKPQNSLGPRYKWVIKVLCLPAELWNLCRSTGIISGICNSLNDFPVPLLVDGSFFLSTSHQSGKKTCDPKLAQICPCVVLLQIASSFAHPNESPAYTSLYFLLPSVKNKTFFISSSLSKKVQTRFVKHADKREQLFIAVIEFS